MLPARYRAPTPAARVSLNALAAAPCPNLPSRLPRSARWMSCADECPRRLLDGHHCRCAGRVGRVVWLAGVLRWDALFRGRAPTSPKLISPPWAAAGGHCCLSIFSERQNCLSSSTLTWLCQCLRTLSVLEIGAVWSLESPSHAPGRPILHLSLITSRQKKARAAGPSG